MSEALAQNDLESLGDYFYEKLGRLPLSEYAADEQAQSIVSRAVSRVDRFMGADSSETDLHFPGDAESQVSIAVSDISQGDYWSGLSRLRRIIEMTLREIAVKEDMDVGRMGAGQLVQRLKGESLLTSEAADLLLESIHICSRAVHGEPISGESAEKALQLAVAGLSEVNQ